MNEKKKAFIQTLITKEFEKKAWLKPKDIYEKAQISKQSFFNLVREGEAEGREVLPIHWRKWRLAMKMGKGEFWKLAQAYFDQD